MTSRPIPLLALALLVLSGPAIADVYTVTLHNGNTFESRYEPQEASYDPNKMVFLDGYGNQIAIAKSDIASIEHDTERKGFGTVIDTTTIAIGWAPNDAPTPEEMADMQANQQGQGRSQVQPFSSQTFGEPQSVGTPASGGVPLGFTFTNTPPMGGSTGEPPVANQ